MIKRDTIQRYRLIPTKDSQGGNGWDREPHETVRAHVSINTTFGEINQYGIKNEQLIHTTTDIKLDEYLEGPSAISFSSDELAPVKVISEFAKKHTNLELKAGIVEGKVAEASELAKYAAIPSREGLLTMLAAGLMGTVKDLSICLDLYAKQKEEN